jgi:2-polyprenyl-3-methyl-5-hydroxy-6-metoxy-1,4-benzoquinol methylase
MTLNAVDYRHYVFAEANDRERLQIQHDAFKPKVLDNFKHILDNYGLDQQLKLAKAQGRQLRILDFGCGEGMYLHDMAEILEKRDLLGAAELSGIDVDPSAIATADDFCKISKPPRHYLKFYVHDGTFPLHTCPGLLQDGHARFDFVYAMVVMEHLPNARHHIEHLYHSLVPGGVLYLRDILIQEGPQAQIFAHPRMVTFGRAMLTTIAKVNNGIEVSTAQPGWLRELGAEHIQDALDLVPIGGDTKQGMLMMRNNIMAIRNSKPHLLASGMMTEAQFDALFDTIYKEFNRETRGQLALVDTIARKPLQ